MDIQERIADLAGPGAQAAGLVVDSVTVSKAGKHTRVIVTVDLPATEIGSADLDRVAQASRDIGKALDDADVPSSEYTLEVSTPGTDRELTEPHHFLRARTRKVELELVAGGTLVGRLTELADGVLTIHSEGNAHVVALDDVSRGRIVVELKRFDDVDTER